MKDGDIMERVPPEVQARYDELIDKRRAESLTPEEYEELLRLTDHVETVGVKRIEALAALARLRGTSLKALMGELGIQMPSDDDTK
jgi:hypothetical protein